MLSLNLKDMSNIFYILLRNLLHKFMLVVFKPPLIQINNHLITETDTLRLWRTHHDQKGMNTKFSQCSMFIVI